MAVLDIILRHFTFIDLHFLSEEIRTECLLQQRITFVFFVGEDAQYCASLPCSLSSRRKDAIRPQYGLMP